MTKKRCTYTIEESVEEKLRDYCDSENRKLSNVVETALKKWLKDNYKKDKNG